MSDCWIGLGGNIGDPIRQMALALRLLDQTSGVRIDAVSSVYRTPPWGKTDQPDFLNSCAGLTTDRTATQVLELCLSIERLLHRERVERWGPRTIDIDLLDFGGTVLSSEHLELPHPRITDRAFVLVPLAEIAPTVRISDRSVTEWRDRLVTSGIGIARPGGDWWREER